MVTLALLVFPWLNPFTSGPNSTVLPYLLSWACASVALLWWAALVQTDTQRLRTVALAWLVAACVSAVLGLLQYFDISRDWAPWVNQPGLGQAYGNLRQRNQFATLCSMGLAALWWWAQQAGPGQSRWRALGTVAVAALLGTAVAASLSRTGLLQLLLLLLLGAWWAQGRRAVPVPQAPGRWIFAVALLAYGLAALALPRLAGIDASVFDRMHESTAQCASRLNLWRNVLYLIAQKPLLGWGWGELDYAHFITLYDAPWAGLRFCDILDNAHNRPLHLAVEFGVPLALLACATLMLWIKQQRPWRELRPERQLAWAVLAVIGVHSLLEYPLWYGPFQLAVLLCVAWLWQTREAALPSSLPARLKPALAAVALLALGWAGADYWRISQTLFAPTPNYLTSIMGSPLAQAKNSWLFEPQVQFARLVTTEVTPANAQAMHALALRVLHYSPEPRVLEKLLESARLVGLEADVALYTDRFARAHPQEYARWLQKKAAGNPPIQATPSR